MVRIFFCLVFLIFSTIAGQEVSSSADGYVREACSVTRYQDLCIHSLASFSSTAKSSPSKWARAGVSVTITEVKNTAAFLTKWKNYSQRSTRGTTRVALSDCIECFQDALFELHKSLGILRSLGRSTFSSQMGDLTTWISAALTDEDTCLDGFEGHRRTGMKSRSLLHSRVLNATYITSNALALVNKLAATGMDDPYKF